MFRYKTDLVKYCHKVYEKEFVSATDGNLSARLPENQFLITPSGKNKGEVQADDLIMIDRDGNSVRGSRKPSTEAMIHMLVYNHRPEINAVIHCHPPYCTTLAITKNLFDKPVLPEVVLSIGKVPLCEYGTPSTEELPDSMLPFIDHANAFLLQNHGAVTLGSSVEEAFFRMEKLEQSAKILYLASLSGNIKELSKKDLDKLYSIAEGTYGISIDKRNKY